MSSKDYRMHYSDQACPALLARSERTASRAEAACGVLLAVVMGCLGAIAVVHFLTPCEAGSLCTLAAIPTRPGLLARVHRSMRRAYLRCRIASAEQDAQAHEMHAAIEPLLAKAARQQADAWRVELAQL